MHGHDDFMWAAGLLEGQGAFYVTRPRSGGPKGRIQCQGSDPAVLRRLRLALGTGLVNGPYPYRAPPTGGVSNDPAASHRSGQRRETARLVWLYQINRQEDVANVARSLKPHMGRVRQNQIGRMLDAMGELQLACPEIQP